MLPIVSVARYLDATAERLKQAQGERTWGCCPFVTISRQAGAGGHQLAFAIMAEIDRRRAANADLYSDWQVFDESILRLLTEHPGLKVSLAELLVEEYRDRIQDTIHQILTGGPPQDLVLARVFHSLRGVAGLGKAVIVGRSGACLTRDLHKGVHVRIAASEETRVKGVARQFQLGPAEALRFMRHLDESRAKVVAHYFHRDIADPLLYDAVWNTDRVTLSDIARWICDRVEQKQAEPEPRPAAAAR